MSNSSINTTNPIGIVSGGTNSSSQSSNGTIYYTGTQLSTTATGSSGQVLRSNGPSVAPTFQTAPTGTGGWSLISTQVASGSTITFSSLSSSYPTYVAIFQSIIVNTSTNNSFLSFQLSTNNGSTWISSLNGNISAVTATGLNGVVTPTGFSCVISPFVPLNTPINAIMWFYNISAATSNSGCYMNSRAILYSNNGGTGGFCTAEAQWILSPTNNINAMQFYVSNSLAGTGIPSGTISLYGINQ